MQHEAPSTPTGETASAAPTSCPASAPPITLALVYAIAYEADVDVRTVERRLAGLPVRGRPGRRIDTALTRHGLARG